jgi:hypothetical protein
VNIFRSFLEAILESYLWVGGLQIPGIFLANPEKAPGMEKEKCVAVEFLKL